MNILELIVGLLIFHICAISGMSLITAKANTCGFLEDNSFLWSCPHIIGILCIFFAAVSIHVSAKFNFLELGLFIAGIFYFFDLLIIGRFFIYGKK